MMPGYWVVSKGRVFQKNANSSGFPKKFQANTDNCSLRNSETEFAV